MELDYSISEFINDSQLPQIPCILKHRYTDFIVHEISMDGIIVSEKLAFDEPRKEEKVIERPAFMTDEIMKTLEGLNESDVFSFKLPSDVSKSGRKQVHAFINTKFSRRLVSNFKDGSMEVHVMKTGAKRDGENLEDDGPPTKLARESKSVEKEEKPMVYKPESLSLDEVLQISALEKNQVSDETTFTKDVKDLDKEERKLIREYIKKNFEGLVVNTESGSLTVKRWTRQSKPDTRDDNRWPADLPDYLHFTLAKENKDTHYAIGLISKFAGVSSKLFTIAGTKDRRAVTYQRVSVYRVAPKKLMKLNLNGMRLGNFSYSNEPLSLGRLWGNRFSIILRNVKDIDREAFSQRIEKWKELGFINYYGAQRFGTCEINTAEVGRLILAQKWEEAVRLILKPRNSETNSPLQECLKMFAETNNPAVVLNKFPFIERNAGIEAMLLKSLRKQRNAYKMAILSLPRNTRSLYVHAYQSLVFNRVASRRIKTHKLTVLNGDVDILGAQLDLNGGEKTLSQVALPLPTSNMNLPENAVGELYKEILQEDAISLDLFAKLGKDFAIGDEVLRQFVVLPKDVDYEFLEYGNPDEDLQAGLTTTTPNKEYNSDERPQFLALKIQFSLPAGTYATIALRELLRIDLSSAFQKTIEHEECEAKDG